MIPIEDGRHHLQRTELEALRAENAELKYGNDSLTARYIKVAEQRDGYVAEVERLTKERDEALQDRDFVQCGLNSCVDDCNALRARVRELEGLLKQWAVEYNCATERGGARTWSVLTKTRAALESGTGAKK